MTDTTPITPPHPFKRIRSLLRLSPKAIALRFVDQAQRKWTGAPVWRFSRITPALYIGGQHSPRGWGRMTKMGINAIVNMREIHKDDAPKGICSDHYLHLATRDNTPPTMADLLEGAQFIAAQIDGGGKVYVHCGVGVGRAPTQAAAYLIYIGMSADDALALIKKARPFVHLTDMQWQALQTFERTYQHTHE